jgi:metal-dependent amidase/aminoacylase/carboxypeptidase family protein
VNTGLHHPAFSPDEAMIADAARYFSALAEKALQAI